MTNYSYFIVLSAANLIIIRDEQFVISHPDLY